MTGSGLISPYKDLTAAAATIKSEERDLKRFARQCKERVKVSKYFYEKPNGHIFIFILASSF